MKFSTTSIDNCFIIEPERIEDERGYFSRVYCAELFKKVGIILEFIQCNQSFNHKAGTLRGMHYQYPSYEAKLVKVLSGSIYDAIIDLHPNSPTFEKWYGLELSSESGKMLYVPPHCAHGYLTLEAATTVFYWVTDVYKPEEESGIRYDDEFFGIKWPRPVEVISAKDLKHRLYG
jgi:dTDP-4-dehydrorhamnose 3,5-epimerase